MQWVYSTLELNFQAKLEEVAMSSLPFELSYTPWLF